MDLQTIFQFFTFAFIGVFNTGFDFILWKVLVKVFSSFDITKTLIKQSGLNLVSTAHFTSFSTAVVLSYFMNKYLTFGEGNKDFESDSFLKFTVINIINLGISTWIIQKLSSNKKLQNKLQQKHKLFANDGNFYNIIKLTTVFLTMLISFFGYKFFVF